MGRLNSFVRAVVVAGLSYWAAAQAATVSYVATDLTDVNPGQDLWSLSYQVSGSFGAFSGFNLVFPAGSFSDLNLVVEPDPSSWSSLVTQPDATLPADGLLGISALADLVANKVPFTIEFVWTGIGSPSSQAFEVFDENFSIVQIGRTIAPDSSNSDVPEPGSLLMVGAALMVLAWQRALARRGERAGGGVAWTVSKRGPGRRRGQASARQHSQWIAFDLDSIRKLFFRVVCGCLALVAAYPTYAQEGERLVQAGDLEGRKMSFVGPPLIGRSAVQIRGGYLFLNFSGPQGSGALSGKYKVLVDRVPLRGEAICSMLRMYDVCVQVVAKPDDSHFIRLVIDGSLSEHAFKVD